MKQFMSGLSNLFQFQLKIVFLFLLCSISKYSIAATFPVTTTTDGTASNTLRGAIAAAEAAGGANTVTVPAGTYNISAGLDLIDFGEAINENITIIGADSATTIIDGGGNCRIFGINWLTGTISGVTVVIKNFTFRNGNASDGYGGGAIWMGGPLNNVSISACAFKTNTSNLQGGAIDIGGDGGGLNIDHCSFISNAVTGGEGGAICARVVNGGGFTESGSITITNAQFGANKAVDGGTIFVVSAGGTGTFALSVQNNSFVGNSGTGTSGGIYVEYEQPGQTAAINYNRFYNNTSGTVPSTLAVIPFAGESVINATNNWWGSNTAPGTTIVSANANINVTPYLKLTVTATPSSTCSAAPGDTAMVTASFLINSAGTILTAANVSTLTGVPIVINSAVKGTLSSVQTTVQSSGTATANFVANATGTGSINYSIDNVPSTPLNISIAAETLPTANQTVTQNTGVNNNAYLASCQLLNKTVPSGATPISGSVTAKVWIESSVPTIGGVYPYVARHYQITPAVGATTATGTITLYFTQAEFNAYNAAPNSGLQLPTTPTDAPGKANLRIGKFPGTSSDNSGLPSTYTGTEVDIDPVDANIVWDATNNWWAITFDVSGFSGFIVQSSTTILPIKLLNFTAELTNNTALLKWDVAQQINVAKYVVEKSNDGHTFNSIDSIAANKLGEYTYSSEDENVSEGKNYYRIKIVDQDGTTTYSSIVIVDGKVNNQDIIIYPNPAKDKFFIKQSGTLINTTAQLTDTDGKILQIINITSSLQPINISGYTSGIYILRLNDGSVYKIIKQ